MTEKLRDNPTLKRQARLAGLLYLLVIAGGLFAELAVRQQLIVYGNPEATAQNILDAEGLFRIGLAVNLAYLLCNIPFALLFYEIFKRTNLFLARLVVLMIVATTTIEAVNLFSLLDVLELLFGEYFSALTGADRHDLVYTQLQNFASGFGVSLVFFGMVCLLYSALILWSRYIPRWIGYLIALAGLCYLINSFAMILSPETAQAMFPMIMVPCFFGELSLAIWLAVKGVSAPSHHMSLDT